MYLRFSCQLVFSESFHPPEGGYSRAQLRPREKETSSAPFVSGELRVSTEPATTAVAHIYIYMYIQWILKVYQYDYFLAYVHCPNFSHVAGLGFFVFSLWMKLLMSCKSAHHLLNIEQNSHTCGHYE